MNIAKLSAYVGVLLAWCVSIILYISDAYEFGGFYSFFFGLFLIALFSFFLTFAWYLLSSYGRVLIKIFLLSTFFLFSVIIVGMLIISYQGTVSIERGSMIVSALELSRKETGTYPNYLSELIPEYLDYIPSSAMGLFNVPYFYLKNGGEFELGYPSGSFLNNVYSSSAKKWEVYD